MNIKALFRNVPATAYLYGLLAVGLIAGYQGWAYQMRERGKLELRIAQHETANADLRHEADSLRKVQRPQTAAAVRTRIKWDTVKAGLDTAWLHDTIPVPVEVVRTVVVTADSAIKSCTLALQTCDQRVAVATRGWDNARAEIATLKANYPSKLAPWRHGAIGGVLGVVVGLSIKR